MVALESIRARWNEWAARAEACTGWASEVTVLARASDILGKTSRRGANFSPSVDRARVDAVLAWARREHAGLLETAANAAAEAVMGGGGARRDSLGAGVKTVTAGWLLRDPLAERARSVHFYGRCVAEFRAPSSTGARASRRVVWLSQGTGECVEATLLPEDDAGGWIRGEADANGEKSLEADGKPAGNVLEGKAAGKVLEGKAAGKVLELLHARVRVLHSTGRRCLVATRPAVVIDPANDPRAAEVVARCPTAAASARYPSVHTIFTAPRVDAPVARFLARVSWIRLPSPREATGGGASGAAVTGRAVDRSAVTREDVAASLLAYGCVECGRELRADPVDSVYRQCECHSGSKDSTGYVWRGITLGLTDDRAARRDEFEFEDDDGRDDPRSRLGKRRKRSAAVEARVDDSELVSRLLLGVTPGDAAWSRDEAWSGDEARSGSAEGCSGSGIDHLALAAAAINALALGGKKNSPMEWSVRAPRLDENGVPLPGPMEVLGFNAVRET